jgi:hypothetical protein
MTSPAVAPSLCACTARKVASLSETLAACWPPRALRCGTAAAGAVLAGRPLRRLSVASVFPPKRVKTRSAISSSLNCSPSFVRSASSRASRSDIRCFSCPISSNVAICSLPPRLPNTGPTPLRRHSPINGGSVHRKKAGCKKLLRFYGELQTCRTAESYQRHRVERRAGGSLAQGFCQSAWSCLDRFGRWSVQVIASWAIRAIRSLWVLWPAADYGHRRIAPLLGPS